MTLTVSLSWRCAGSTRMFSKPSYDYIPCDPLRRVSDSVRLRQRVSAALRLTTLNRIESPGGHRWTGCGWPPSLWTVLRTQTLRFGGRLPVARTMRHTLKQRDGYHRQGPRFHRPEAFSYVKLAPEPACSCGHGPSWSTGSTIPAGSAFATGGGPPDSSGLASRGKITGL